MHKTDKVAALLQTARRYESMFEELLREDLFGQAALMLRNARSCREAALAIQQEESVTPRPAPVDSDGDDGLVTVREASDPEPSFAIPPKPEPVDD